MLRRFNITSKVSIFFLHYLSASKPEPSPKGDLPAWLLIVEAEPVKASLQVQNFLNISVLLAYSIACWLEKRKDLKTTYFDHR